MKIDLYLEVYYTKEQLKSKGAFCMNNDLTVGAPSKQLRVFCIPLLLSAMFQQLYNIADSVIAGQFAGKDALAAIGASYCITMIFMAVAIGANTGCNVIVSMLYGAKDFERMKTSVWTSLISVSAVSILLTVVGVIFCRPMLILLATPDNIMTDAAVYLDIYIYGLFFLFLYNICTGIFSALGDSKTPFYFLVASSIGNVVLDLLFVAVFHWGVAGAAWATFLAQGAAAVLALVVLLKRVAKIESGPYPRFSFPMLRKICVVAIPSILQQSFISVGNLFIQNLVNGFGSDVVAGYSAAIKLNTFALTSFTTLGNGTSVFTAQNLGAQKTDRVRQGFRAGCTISVVIAVLFTLVYVVFSRYMIGLFVNINETEVVAAGTAFLRIASPFYAVISIKLMGDGVLRGAGAMKSFMVATFSDLILRVVLAMIMSPIFGSNGIWYSWPIGWTIATCITMGFYFSGIWKHTELLDKPVKE